MTESTLSPASVSDAVSASPEASPGERLQALYRAEQSADRVLLVAAEARMYSAGFSPEDTTDAMKALRRAIRVYRSGKAVGGKDPMSLDRAAEIIGQEDSMWLVNRHDAERAIRFLPAGTRKGSATVNSVLAEYFGQTLSKGDAKRLNASLRPEKKPAR